MRTSVFSRSAIAVATLAIGSVALAGAPATAATPSGITRDQVLTAAAGLRAPEATFAQSQALDQVTDLACAAAPGDEVLRRGTTALTAGDDADGFAVTAVVYPSGRNCSFVAVATTDAAYQLSGNLTVTSTPTLVPLASATTLSSGPLSGDVFVTTPYVAEGLNTITATADGAATKTTSTRAVVKVKDKKSKAEKKAAKKKYSKRLAQAKKNYAKALDKAGRSKSKKAAAKRVYAKARALAKAKYAYAIAGYKNVTRTVPVTDSRPFSITGSYTYTA